MKLLGWAAGAVVAGAVVSSFTIPVADNDLWGHIYFGREILSSGSLPAVNQYSYTAPSYPWINHEILAECAFAAIYDRFLAPGLLALRLVVGLVTLAVMARTARRRTNDPLAVMLALVVAISLMAWGFLIRPQLFSFLALAILWDRLGAFASGERRGSLWILPLVFAIWINTHGGVMAGIVVLACFTALWWGLRLDPKPPRELVIVTAASAAALLLNPYGWRLLHFLLEDVRLSRDISEWSAIPVFDLSNLQFKLALALAAIGALFSTRRELPFLAIIGLVAIATFRHERHLPIFAILAAPHLAATFADLLQRFGVRARELSREAAATLAAVILLVVAVQLTAAWRLNRDLGFQIYVSPVQYPIGAVRFLEQQRLSGNLALSFDWGEYAIWHLYPAFRVSVDGRYTTAYPAEIIEQSWRFMQGSPGWEEILADASVALVDRRHPGTGRIAELKEWRQVYGDSTALVFVREGAAASTAREKVEGTLEATVFP